MKAGPIQHCYLCHTPLRKYELSEDEARPLDDVDPDHVPPAGLFPKPRPSDLLTVPCCVGCNNRHSGFDERLRLVASMPFDRNQAGQNILSQRVIGGTLAKGRQMRFAKAFLGAMEPLAGKPGLILARLDAAEFKEGMIRITKGLLATLYPRFDYRNSTFEAIDIHPEPFEAQLKTMGWLKTGQCWERGNGVFKAWNHVDEVAGGGAWMLVFYECFGFFVFHTNGPEIEIMRQKLKLDLNA